MLIQTIAAQALKGQTFRHELTPVTMITGQNDSGKTARADAVRLLLLGYLPELGKTNKDTFALSGGSKLEVHGDIVRTGDGSAFTVRREWAKAGKVVKASSTGVDILPDTPLVLLNGADYFGRSAAGQINMVFETMRIDGSRWSIEKLQAEFGGLRLNPQPQESVQAWLERYGEYLDESIREARATSRRYAQTAQGISVLAANETPVDPARVAADMQATRERLESLTGILSTAQEQARQEQANAEQRALVTRGIAEKRAAIGDRALPGRPVKDIWQALRDAESRLATLRAEFGAAQRAWGQAVKNHDRVEALRKKVQAAEQIDFAPLVAEDERLEKRIQGLDSRPVDIGALQKAVTVATSALAAARQKQATLDKQKTATKADYDKLRVAPCCPTCRRAGDYRAAVDQLFTAAFQDQAAQAEAIGREYAAAKEALDAANSALSDGLESENLRAKLKTDSTALRSRIDALRAQQEAAQQAQQEIENLGDIDITEPHPPAELDQLSGAIGRLHDDYTRAEAGERLAELQQQLDAMKPPGGQPAAQRIEEIQQDIVATRAHIGELETRQQLAANQSADAKRLEEAREQCTVWETKAEELDKTRKAVAEKRAEIVTAIFGPLLESARRFTAGILDSPLEYRDGEIGRFVGASWVPVRCMGGTHQAVTYAGIQAALGASAPARLVIVDEMGRFDVENKRKFLVNISEAIEAGIIDQFLGIDVRAEDYETGAKAKKPILDGMTVLKLG